MALWLRVVLSWARVIFPAAAIISTAMPGCNDACGNVTVPYPFGIGDSKCAINDHFLLNCIDSYSPPQLFFFNIRVQNISVEEGTMIFSMWTAYQCYNMPQFNPNFSAWSFNLGVGGPFRFSNTRNKLFGLGCNALAFMSNKEATSGSGCLSYCSQSVNFTEDSSCTGFGCCQVSVPKNLTSLVISISRAVNDSIKNMSLHYPCEYAFLADVRSFNVSDWKLTDTPDKISNISTVIEWVVEEKDCSMAEGNATSYACRANAQCVDSINGNGYRCLCKEGFDGNPYIQGCQDIDECMYPNIYPCHGTCKNTIGNYTCRCPIGMHGDGKVECQGFRISTIFAVSGASVSSAVIVLLIVIILKKRRKERYFLRNGGMLLRTQRVRIFSEAELTKATKNYDSVNLLGEGGFGFVYRGVLADNTYIAVKKPKQLDKTQINEDFQQEIGIVSQVNHKNVVKLLGLCLETKVPLLVYEFISNGTLYHHIHDKRSQILSTWKSRLRIAAETALALDYLHSLASPPIIHGDIKSTNILLDDNHTAKVSDFGASVLISPGQTDIATKIQGTLGYLDPEYLMTGILTTKSDVYSFGVLLVELLTGEKPNSGVRSGERSNIIQYFMSSVENNHIEQILCFNVNDGEMEEIEIFAELAKLCLKSSGMKRPTMKEVAEELARLIKLQESIWSHQNSEETEHLLGESALSHPSISNAKINKADTLCLATFDIEFSADSI